MTVAVSITTFKPTAQQRRLAKAINELAYACHAAAVESGWYSTSRGKPKKRNVGEMIALEHSELSEALEALRKNLFDDKLKHRKGDEVETGDAMIRMFDRAAYLGYDLGGAIIEKMHFNANRPDHKLANRRKKNGKKF